MKKLFIILLSVVISTTIFGQSLTNEKQSETVYYKTSDIASGQIGDKHLKMLNKSKKFNNKVIRSSSAIKQRLDSIIENKYSGYTDLLAPFKKAEYVYDGNGNTISETTSYWDEYNNIWYLDEKFEYGYDISGNLIWDLEYAWDDYNYSFNAYWKNEYTNDINGNPTFIVSSYREEVTSQWGEYWKGEYEYDSYSNLISSISYDWDDNTSQWIKKYRNEYTYNSSQNLISEIHSDWNTSTNEWRYVLKDEYTYDINENLLLWMHYQWPYDGSNEWVEYSKYENTFNASGNITLQVWFEWDFILFQWHAWRKFEYSYNTNNELEIAASYSWNLDASQWKPTVKNDYTRDVNGNTLTDNYSSWDENTNQWINTGICEYEYDYAYDISDLLLPDTWDFLQIYPENIVNMLVDFSSLMLLDNAWEQTNEVTYYYSEANVGVDEIPEYKIKIFPVPATDFILFDMDNSLYPASIELYNIQGKRVLSGTIYDNEQISVQELASGMHMYIIVTNNGKFSGKFMIK